MEEVMLLIGATGKIGRHLVPILAAAGITPTILARDVDRAFEALGPTAHYVAGDLADPTTLAPAFAGQEVVYLAVGQTDDQVTLEKNAIDAAVAAGVKRIVKISALAAQLGIDGPNPYVRWHAEIEQYLAAAPIASTILRPNVFDDNLLGSAAQIAEGQLFSTTADGRIAWIYPADIAEAAAVALLDDDHAGKVYEISGPEALTYDELAQRFSAVLGRPVQWIGLDDASFRSALESAGLPAWVVSAYVELNSSIRVDGVAGVVSQDLPTLLGRPATSIDTWIQENRSAFGA
jgi:uncharacterized protein YbjT (DUF2867 family)